MQMHQVHQVQGSVGMWRNFKTHKLDSDFGVVEHSRARPDRNEVGRLILVNKDWVDQGGDITQNVDPWPSWVTTEDGRTFFHIEYANQSWKWELFSGHWTDIEGPCPCYIGVAR